MGVQELFYPRGVAVVGSMSEGKLGFELLKQIYKGGYTQVYAINPKSQGAFGIQAFDSVLKVKQPLDLAVIASPPATVVDALKECGQAGIEAAVVITSGFSEVGNKTGEDEIKQIANQYGIRIVGPNCAGIVSSAVKLYATLEVPPPPGAMALISQSGALGGAVLSWAEEQGVGISKFVSYGNRVDLDELDLLPYLAQDKETRVAALYIESVTDGRRFMQVIRDFCQHKPLVIIKSGRTNSGRRAALSHTGSLAGSDAVYDAAIRSAGAIRVETVEEMFDLCKGFAGVPPIKGRKVVVVTNSGGPGILAADRAEAAGLDVAEVKSDIRKHLTDMLPPNCAVGNPIDLTVQGTEEGFRDVLTAVLPVYDAAITINVATPYLDSVALARGICDAAHASGKPVVASFMAGHLVSDSVDYLEGHGVPNFPIGERAASVLARMATFEANRSEIRSMDKPPDPAGVLPGEPGIPMLEPDAMAWLQQNQIPVPAYRFAREKDEAIAACRTIGYPVVMKVVSPEIIHKSDFGGVILGIKEDTAAGDAFDHLAEVAHEKQFQGVMIYPLIQEVQEVLLGCSRDPQFGPVVLVGVGGIYTETLRDVTLRIAPVTQVEAKVMISELKTYPILAGARGQAGYDLEELAKLIENFSKLPFLYPEIAEMDLNPVFLCKEGLFVGDVRVIKRG